MINKELNIDYNIQLLLLKALNKYPTQLAACKPLGVTTRTLRRYILKYKLHKRLGIWVK